jgi:hypothetical protein
MSAGQPENLVPFCVYEVHHETSSKDTLLFHDLNEVVHRDTAKVPAAACGAADSLKCRMLTRFDAGGVRHRWRSEGVWTRAAGTTRDEPAMFAIR